jgi:dTDP-4-amino-4,6-dideoxy-D-galactose acyltransferase
MPRGLIGESRALRSMGIMLLSRQPDIEVVPEILPWDSEFFGFGVARLYASSLTPESVSKAKQWCQANQVRCLYWLSRADRTEVPSAFQLVDERVTYVWNTHPIQSETTAVRPFLPADLDSLENLARQSHRNSRFYSDPHFDKSKCDELYATWIRKSCRGWANAVWVSVVAENPVGYLTCHRGPDGSGSIGLVAVADNARGRGLGRQLVAAAQAYFHAEGVGQVSVVTQGKNEAAQRLYEVCGFECVSREFWYHFWC